MKDVDFDDKIKGFPPLSLIALAITMFIYLPQHIPYLGALWALFNPLPFGTSATLVNFIFLFLILDIFMKKAPKIFLLLPIMFFSGYLYFAMNNNALLIEYRDQKIAENSEISMPYDRRTHSLIVMNNGNYEVANKLKEHLLVRHGVSAIYYPKKVQYLDTEYMSSRLAKNEDCAYIKSKSLRHLALYIRKYDSGPNRQQLCIIDYPEDPSGFIIEIKKTNNPKSFKNGLNEQSVSINNGPNEYKYGAISMRLWPLTPQYMFECKSSARYETAVGMFTILIPPTIRKFCRIGFQHKKETTYPHGNDENSSDLALVSLALGLKKISRDDLIQNHVKDIDLEAIDKNLVETITPRLEAEREKRAKKNKKDRIVYLYKFLKKPISNQEPSWFPQGSRLEEDTALASSLGQKYLAALNILNKKREFGKRSVIESKREILSKQISALPEQQFLDLVPKLINMFRSYENDPDYRGMLRTYSGIIVRFGDLKESHTAQKFLLDHLEQYYQDRAYGIPKAVLLGICRAGQTMAEKALPQLIYNYQDEGLVSASSDELALTLLRLGHTMPKLQTKYWNEEQLRPDGGFVNSSSPISVCRD